MKFDDGTLWLLGGKVALSAMYCPGWDHWAFFVSENGGRFRGDCLDLNAAFWRFKFGCTIWGLGRLSKLIGWIPAGRAGRGHCVGYWTKSPAI